MKNVHAEGCHRRFSFPILCTVLIWALTSTAMAGGQGCECDGHSIGLHISSSGRGSGSLVCLRVRHRPSLGPKLGRGRGRQANHSVCASQRQRHGAGDAARAGRRTGPRQYPGSHCQRDTLDVGSLTQKSSVGSKAPAVLPSSAPTLRHAWPPLLPLARAVALPLPLPLRLPDANPVAAVRGLRCAVGPHRLAARARGAVDKAQRQRQRGHCGDGPGEP